MTECDGFLQMALGFFELQMIPDEKHGVPELEPVTGVNRLGSDATSNEQKKV